MLPSTRISESGRFSVLLEPVNPPAPVNEIHNWRLLITDRDNGSVFQPELVQIDGGMEHHGHGLPTQPQATEYDPSMGTIISGVKFTMNGLWQLNILFHDGSSWDTVKFQVSVGQIVNSKTDGWNKQELAILKSLILPSEIQFLDATNRYLNHPAAQDLGHKFFNEEAFSKSGSMSCASCHDPELYFTDGRSLSMGMGLLARNSPTIVGTGDQNWFYWDGRRDSAWSQALVPFEASKELAGNRLNIVKTVIEKYRVPYEEIFGPLPDLSQITHSSASPVGEQSEKIAWNEISRQDQLAINRAYVNVGKSIAAYESLLKPKPSRFDLFATLLTQGEEGQANNVLSSSERNGLKLFINSKTKCLSCHNGPMFSNRDFHNIGTGPDGSGNMDFGRMFGVQAALIDEFNCKGQWSDNPDKECPDIRYLNQHEISGRLSGAFKVPTLRGITRTAPYMHDGRYPDLKTVLGHYVSPPDYVNLTEHEIPDLSSLDQQSVRDIIAFIKTLGGDIMADQKWLRPE